MEKINNLNNAVLFCLGYALCVSLCVSCAKIVSTTTTQGMIVFSRFSIGMVYLGIILLLQKAKGKLDFTIKTKHLGLHILRATAAFLAQFAIFYAAKFIPVTTANLLLLTHPLFVPILSAIFLATVTGKKNWTAILIGFLGITLILKPGNELFNPAAFIGLAGGFLAAVSILGVHEIGKFDKALTIMFYYFAIAFLISLVLVVFTWKTPANLHMVLLLLAIGITGAIAQECSIRALIAAPAKIVAPMMYLTVVISGILDWFIWKNALDLVSWLGIITVCSSSIMLILINNQTKQVNNS